MRMIGLALGLYLGPLFYSLYGQCAITINPLTGLPNCKSVAGATGPSGAGLTNCSETSSILTCPGGFSSSGTTAGNVTLSEASVNGSNFVAWKAPDSLAADTTYLIPSTPPSGNQVLQCGTPSAGVSTCTFITAGSGGGVQRVAYSAIPATCDSSNTNTLYKLTNGFLNVHCSGSTYQWYTGDVPITLPGAISGWTQVNTPTEAIDQTGAIYFRDAAHSGVSAKSALKAISGTDWVLTLGFTWEGGGHQLGTCGLAVSDGTAASNQLLILGITAIDNAVPYNLVRTAYHYNTNYTSTPTGSLISSPLPAAGGELTFARIAKSGSNWTFSYSTNSQKFSALQTVAAPFTATHAGFACDSRGDGTADSDAAMLVIHYTNQ